MSRLTKRLRKPVGVVEDGGGAVAAEVGGAAVPLGSSRDHHAVTAVVLAQPRTRVSLREVGTFCHT